MATLAHGADYKLTLIPGYDSVVNDDHIVRILEETVFEIMGKEAIAFVKPNMGAETFLLTYK